MRHRQFLLVGLGLFVLAFGVTGQAWSQQRPYERPNERPNVRILRYAPPESAAKYHVTIMGEVARPGVYEFDRPNVSLPELIDLAGGLNEATASRNIYSFRSGRPGPQTFYTPDSQFAIMPGDVLAAGRRPEYGSSNRGIGEGSVTSTAVEAPQVVLLGLLERPVLLRLPMNAASIPGLFALLRQDRNPGRSIAVYPPNGAPFSYTAQNTQPVPLASGTIVTFAPGSVLLDDLPALPPVVNEAPREQNPNQVAQPVMPRGPKVLVNPVSTGGGQGYEASPTAPLEIPQETSGGLGEQQNSSGADAPRFRMTTVTPGASPAEGESSGDLPTEASGAEEPAAVEKPIRGGANSGTELPREREQPATGLQFPSRDDSKIERASISREATGLKSRSVERTERAEDLLADEEEGISLREQRAIAEAGATLNGKSGKAVRAANSLVPIWLVMVMTGIGVFCVAGLAVLLRDMQQFKRIVIQTRDSQSVLDRLVRGELPLHEETIEPAYGQHYSARANPPVRRQRVDEAHASAGQERWVPAPHAAFQDRAEPTGERVETSVRIDRESSARESGGAGRPTAGGRVGSRGATVSSSTILDRILSSVNGDRNARRS